MATVQYTTVKCEKCDNKFKLKPKIMKVTKISEDIEKHFFLELFLFLAP